MASAVGNSDCVATCGRGMRSLISQGKRCQGRDRMSPCTDELKLVALDKDDIEVISAHVQDSLVKVADIWWQPSDCRFVQALNRFRWKAPAETARGGRAAVTGAKPEFRPRPKAL